MGSKVPASSSSRESSEALAPVIMVSRIRQNFQEDCEAFINKQINMEFYASFVYLSMASYFSRDDQALLGFSKYFRKASGEEREHGMKLMDYQVKRGGSRIPRHLQTNNHGVGLCSGGHASSPGS